MTAAILTTTFTIRELQFLQTMCQGFNEEKWANMGANEHAYFQDFLNQVRASILHPTFPVVFTDAGQLDFIRTWFTYYKNNAGEYIFTGVWGDNVRIGQFPTGQGSANQNFTAQGSYPEEAFLEGADIFNSILRKLGEIIYPPASNIYHSPGSV